MSDETVRAAADAVQWLNLAVSVVVLALLLLAMWRWRRGWRLIVLPLTYMALSTAFYVAVLLHVIPSPWISLYSAALRLYSYVLAVVIAGAVALSALTEDDEEAGDD